MHTSIKIQPGILKKPNGYNSPQCLIVQDFTEDTLIGFTQALNQVNNSPQPVVPIQISSFGGMIFGLLGILDIIKKNPKPILTFTNSYAMSCGAVLLAAGSKGYRYASESATILIHEASGSFEGKKSDVANEMLQMEQTNEKLMEALAHYSNKPKGFYKNLVRRAGNTDLYINPKQAREWGLIDHIGVVSLDMEITAKYTIKTI